jgi:hypothetical protein
VSFANAFGNLFRIAELRKRLAYTLALLAVYRIGVFVTAPGVNRVVMKKAIEASGGFLNLFNLFTGGALEQLSIFALGIMPYVSASIILQLLTMVFKPLDELRKEGEQGQRKINQYTRYGTIVLSLLQAFGIAMSLEGMKAGNESVALTTRRDGASASSPSSPSPRAPPSSCGSASRSPSEGSGTASRSSSSPASSPACRRRSSRRGRPSRTRRRVPTSTC